MIPAKVRDHWTHFWMRRAGLGLYGRFATRMATLFIPPDYGRWPLSRLNPKGYVSPSARIHHNEITFGQNIFIGDRVMIFADENDGGRVEIGDRVNIHGETCILTGQGGKISIGCDTNIEMYCNLTAYKAAIKIGKNVGIGPRCAFFPYDHATSAGELIHNQGLTTKGDIDIGDGSWLGFGVIVLSGVRIGAGAVIGAGSVVVHSIPEDAVAVGNPARVIGMRKQKL